MSPPGTDLLEVLLPPRNPADFHRKSEGVLDQGQRARPQVVFTIPNKEFVAHFLAYHGVHGDSLAIVSLP